MLKTTFAVAEALSILLDAIITEEPEVAYELTKAKACLRDVQEDGEEWADINLYLAGKHIFKAMELTEDQDLYDTLNAMFALLQRYLP